MPLLTVSLISPAQVRLNWTASCSAGGEDYGIYQGTIGSWYSHTLVVCHDGGTPLQEDAASGEGNRYYLVVPHSADAEGSYGRSSTGLERPPGTTACVSPQVVTVCP